jgi:GTP-binding protein
VHQAIEKFSVIKALEAIENCQVAIVVIDAREGLTDQDLTLIGYVLNAGRALVIAINKWDGLDSDQREHNRNTLKRRLEFVSFAAQHFISARHGTGVGELMGSVDQAYASVT